MKSLLMKSLLMKNLLATACALMLTQTGCVVVGGYSSEGGWYLWPGGLVISAVLIALWLLWRGRRRG